MEKQCPLYQHQEERKTRALLTVRRNGKAMPSLSAPGREKDQRGGEKVAAEDDWRAADEMEKQCPLYQHQEERKTSAEVRRWPQKSTLRSMKSSNTRRLSG